MNCGGRLSRCCRYRGPKLKPGRPRVPDRQALCGILFVLHTGIQWEYLPQELGFGSGMTCWRRLKAWNKAGVWDRLHVILLERLQAAEQLDWSRPVIGSSHVRAARRGPKAGPARTGGGHNRAVGPVRGGLRRVPAHQASDPPAQQPAIPPSITGLSDQGCRGQRG